MSQAFTDQDITNFLTDMLEIGGTMKVDSGPDKFIRLKNNQEIITLAVNGVPKPLAVFGTKSSEAVIINPFAEGSTTASQNAWFYSNRTRMISIMLISIITKMLEYVAKGKKKKTDDEPNMLIVEYVSKYAPKITDATIKDFNTVSKDSLTFMNIFYNKKNKTCEVKLLPFSQKQQTAFSGVSANSWDIFRNLILDILKISEPSELSYTAQMMGAPNMEAFSHVFTDIYERMMPFFDIIGVEHTVDINGLKAHLKYLPQYHARAKWCMSLMPTATNDTAPVQQTVIPTPNMAMPTQMSMANMPFSNNMGMPMIPQQAMIPGMNPMMGGMPSMFPNGMGMPMIPQQAIVPIPQQTMMPGGGMLPQQAVQAPMPDYATRTGNPFARA